MTDAGEVFVVHSNDGTLYQTVGTLSGNTITLQDFLVTGQTTYEYDSGSAAHVATNGKIALQMFHNGDENLCGNAALVFDRANWMGDQRDGVLKGKTLRQIAFPGSHDAGAFAHDIAETQDLSIREQLRAGVRYFDIRPEFSGDKKNIDVNKITTYHDIGRDPAGDYRGPTLPNLVRSIRFFMSSHNELVILRISQFKNFNADVFKALAGVFVGDAAAKTGLKDWLFPLKTDGIRLADRPLTDFLKPAKGTVLIVVDVDGSNINPSDKPVDYITDAYRQMGLYRYRDWYAKDPAKGDLTVFDVFSNTNTFSEMSINSKSSGSQYAIPPNNEKLPIGQLDKFDWFDGLCQKDDTDPKKRSKVQCDLFLNSWTLTPKFPTHALPNNPTAFRGANRANQNLTSYLAIPFFQGANRSKQTMNMLYTDAVEFSRSVDVAMIRNGFGT